MNNWVETNISIGEIIEGNSKLFTFESTKPLDINTVVPHCGSCTKFIDYKNNVLTIKYDGEYIPAHLKRQGQSTIMKSIEVHYKDGTRETLRFSGVLKRR